MAVVRNLAVHGEGPRICISNSVPGDTDAPGPVTTL